jgi:hypothetical protein
LLSRNKIASQFSTAFSNFADSVRARKFGLIARSTGTKAAAYPVGLIWRRVGGTTSKWPNTLTAELCKMTLRTPCVIYYYAMFSFMCQLMAILCLKWNSDVLRNKNQIGCDGTVILFIVRAYVITDIFVSTYKTPSANIVQNSVP